MSYRARLIVSFVNAGGQPAVIQAALRAKAAALAVQPGVPAEVLRDAELQAEVAAGPCREVARFQRVLDVPVPLFLGVGLNGVGPVVFEPGQVTFDVAAGQYEAVEIINLCHSRGPCPCQRLVRAYMGAAEWGMLSEAYLPRDAG